MEQHRVAALAVTVALSLHSIPAGLALRLQSTLAGAFALLLAVVAHKGAAAFALGVSLDRGAIGGRKVLTTVVGFSLTTPLGIVLGPGFGHVLEDQGAKMSEALFDGLAAGTFLYLATMDILAVEFASPQATLPKLAWLGAGLRFMAVLALWL